MFDTLFRPHHEVTYKANFEGANLSDVLFDRAVINEANLKNAVLARAVLTRSDLGGANIEGTDFSNALIDRTQQLVRFIFYLTWLTRNLRCFEIVHLCFATLNKTRPCASMQAAPTASPGPTRVRLSDVEACASSVRIAHRTQRGRR